MPKELFYSYSHKDEELRDELDQHLSLLQRNGLIVGWHDRRIGAGDEWRDAIDAHVHSADIILLLVSSSFLASEYCYGIELKIALERHARHEAIVIPIILRPVDWSEARFAHLQALPKDAKAITLWPNRDEAFASVAKSIRAIVLRSEPAHATTGTPVAVADEYLPKARVLDAAIPTHVVKGRGTELLVLIRLPESAGLSGILLEDDVADARPEDVRSRPFSVSFPVGHDGAPEPLKVNVTVTSPDFSPAEQTKKIYVPVEADSEVCPFMLTPICLGQLKLLIELQWEDALRGHRRLLTECVAEAASGAATVSMHVVRVPVEVVQTAGSYSWDPIKSAPVPQFPMRSTVSTPQWGPPEGTTAEKPTPSASYEALPRMGPPPAPASGPAVPRHEQQEQTMAPRVPPIARKIEVSGRSGSKGMPRTAKKSGGVLVTSLAAAVVLFAAIGVFTFTHKAPIAEMGARAPIPAQPTHASDVIAGQVIDATTGRPLPAAKASLTPEGSEETFDAVSNEDGRFSIDAGTLQDGAKAKFSIRAKGYEPLEHSMTLSSAAEEVRVYPLHQKP